jgi:phage baseplate assembly protein W
MSYDDYNSTSPRYIVRNDDKVYADLDLSLAKHPIYDDIRPLKDIAAVKNSVRNLILTNRGERPFQPNVGSGIFDLLFEHINVYNLQSVRASVEDMLYSYEPRINQISTIITPDRSGENGIIVSVNFNISGIASEQTMDFYLERLR